MLFRVEPEQHIHLSKSKMNTSLFLYPVLLAMQCICCSSNLDIEQAPTDVYRNPIIGRDGPDPTVLRDTDGTFWLYNTADLLSIWHSDDLVTWQRAGSAFNEQTRPAESRYDYGKAALWAPEIRIIRGKYVLFFSMWWGDVGTYDGHSVAYAVADSPAGPFEFRGQIINSDPDYPPYYGTAHSIDQFYLEDGGKPYLFWGSFRGLYAAELEIADDLAMAVKPETIRRVAGGAYEGSCVYKRGDYYYLFASEGDWTGGMSSTYRTVVGRSKSLFGPYVDKQGRRMLDNRHELLIAGDNRFAGTGHNSNIIEDDKGQTWMFYHAYDSAAPDKGRQTMLDLVQWDDEGWPRVNTGHPSQIYGIPAITR